MKSELRPNKAAGRTDVHKKERKKEGKKERKKNEYDVTKTGCHLSRNRV
jgi:hypothetical protein